MRDRRKAGVFLDHLHEFVAGHPSGFGEPELAQEGDQPHVAAELDGDVGAFDYGVSPSCADSRMSAKDDLLTKVIVQRRTRRRKGL